MSTTLKILPALLVATMTGGGPGGAPCGDGTCDTFELANPGLCPVDCT